MVSRKEWIESGGHLPSILRDFHDQKHLFRELVGETVDINTGEVRVSWIDGQIHIIDRFLHIMANYGWTLQRTRKHVDDGFPDLKTEVDKRIEAGRRLFFESIKKHPPQE